MARHDIEVGYATKLGTLAGAAAAVAALVAAVVDGDHTPETLGALAAAAIAFYKVMDGRYRQAAAAVPRAIVPADLPLPEPAAEHDDDDEETPEPDEFDPDGHLFVFEELGDLELQAVAHQVGEGPNHAEGNPQEDS